MEVPERPEVTAAKERLAGLLPQALNTLEELLESPSQGARLGASKEILDRGGLPAHVAVDQTIEVGLNDQIELMLGKLAKAREVAYQGAEALLSGAEEGVFEPTLFDDVTMTPQPELMVAERYDDDEPVMGEVVEEGWWQASPSD